MLGPKIVSAYEGIESFVEISKLDGLFECQDRLPKKEEMNSIDFSRFWAEQSWGQAVVAASTADMIIVSLSGRADLPLPVQRWMESWPHHERVKHPALVVMFGSEEPNPPKQSDLVSYFQQIAESHGFDFFCNLTGLKTPAASAAHFHLN